MRVTPRVLSFDLDDTLWACHEVIERAEQALHDWLQRHYPRIPAEYDRAAMRDVRRRMAEARPALGADLTALRRESLAWHAERAGYDRALAEEGVAVFLRERQRVTPFADVRPALEALARDYPLVALTNGNADIRRTELGHLFRHAFSAADVGAAKPDPALFRAACDALGVRTAELVHIGDDPLRDVHGARRFGARTVWVRRAFAPWPDGVGRAHHEIASLTELPPLLAAAAG
ncbi:MAG TPA: HAD family hydrolase [Gammaproteobacteria bacterium]|nr:HAD family hydrolase [Gammaproteobacteria bacterium]